MRSKRWVSVPPTIVGTNTRSPSTIGVSSVATINERVRTRVRYSRLKMIQTLRQREEAIEACGIDAVVIVPFTRDFSLTSAEDFVRVLLVRRLAAREVHVGEHFVFGKGREGTIQLLRRIGAENGMEVEGISDVVDPRGAISSTRIRNALQQPRVIGYTKHPVLHAEWMYLDLD